MIAIGFVLFVAALMLGGFAIERGRRWSPVWWNLSVCGGWLGMWLMLVGIAVWLWQVAP